MEEEKMSKTLADMTPEERSECVGMWCDVRGFARVTPIVDMWEKEVELLVYNNLRGNIIETYEFHEVIPRFDLPRVWTPGGHPVAMMKETGFCGTAGLETTVHKYGSGTVYVPDYTPYGEVYRWVGEWEPANE